MTELETMQNVYNGRATGKLEGMTQTKWSTLSPAQRDAIRDNSGLNRQLIGLEGWRVEVQSIGGSVYRFQVGKSTGWRPRHLSLHNSRSHGGVPISERTVYDRVTPIRKVR